MRLGEDPPGVGPPSFLDSNPSDPIITDLTHQLWPTHPCDGAQTRSLYTNYLRWSEANLSNQKITLPPGSHTKKTKLTESMNSLHMRESVAHVNSQRTGRAFPQYRTVSRDLRAHPARSARD